MNEKTQRNIHRFGKAGTVILTILMIAAVIITLLLGTAAIYTATLPKDAVVVSVTNRAAFRINENIFSSVWGMLVENFQYAADTDPSAMLSSTESDPLLPPEDTELTVNLHFFNQSYSTATIRSEEGNKVIDATSAPEEYRSSDLMVLLAFAALTAAASAAGLLILQKLFKVLAVCASPFCTDFVVRLRNFGYSLLPVVLFASIGETLAVRFLSAGKSGGIFVQWGLLIAFAVTMCLVTVFRYGVQLQTESDETL